MSKRVVIRSFGVVLCLMMVLPLAAFGADKLVVKDAAGINTVFSVDDTGLVTTSSDITNNGMITSIKDWGSEVATHLVYSATSYGDANRITYRQAGGTVAAPTASRANIPLRSLQLQRI
jgi:hypothetical protein